MKNNNHNGTNYFISGMANFYSAILSILLLAAIIGAFVCAVWLIQEFDKFSQRNFEEPIAALAFFIVAIISLTASAVFVDIMYSNRLILQNLMSILQNQRNQTFDVPRVVEANDMEKPSDKAAPSTESIPDSPPLSFDELVTEATEKGFFVVMDAGRIRLVKGTQVSWWETTTDAQKWIRKP